ncbi:hypothetical protein GCM10023238_03530 [Streptomyces heliomycini]
MPRRVAETERRLAEVPDGPPLVLVNHWPLHRHPTEVLWYPEFAMWCGTVLTDDWAPAVPVHTVVYGHLHIPRTTRRDGVRFEEVSVAIRASGASGNSRRAAAPDRAAGGRGR